MTSSAYAAPPSAPTITQVQPQDCITWYNTDPPTCDCRAFIDFQPSTSDGGFPIVAYGVVRDGTNTHYYNLGGVYRLIDQHLDPDTSYTHAVFAINSNGEKSPPSTTLATTSKSCMTDDNTAPTNLWSPFTDCTSVLIVWDTPVDTLDGLFAYRVLRTGGNVDAALGEHRSFLNWIFPVVNDYFDDGGYRHASWQEIVQPDTTYYYAVEALVLQNGAGTISPLSNIIEISVPVCP